ncbi:hypothetical protein FACS189483_10580 [Spirochaetia bacterium]|nr:hypothetical protein FACS189483_10580 [Spirochaetia bacterium]
MNAEEVLEIISLGETSAVQFKEAFDNQDKIAAEMIAFANSKGGMIIFGVNDKTGKVSETDFFQRLKEYYENGKIYDCC